MSSKKPAGKTTRSAISDVVAREYTIHMHKRLHGATFKKRAVRCLDLKISPLNRGANCALQPKAIKEIKKFATQAMVCPISKLRGSERPMRAVRRRRNELLLTLLRRAPPTSASTPS